MNEAEIKAKIEELEKQIERSGRRGEITLTQSACIELGVRDRPPSRSTR